MKQTYNKLTNSVIRRYCFIFSVLVAWGISFVDGIVASGSESKIDYFEPIFLMAVIFLISYAISMLMLPKRKGRAKARKHPIRRDCKARLTN
ncbi:MAG: hypothetical protein GY718_00560 [Lentisphaerae bacterium]|nr:hypothetical protein [Lentisphaerota bacterium]